MDKEGREMVINSKAEVCTLQGTMQNYVFLSASAEEKWDLYRSLWVKMLIKGCIIETSQL